MTTPDASAETERHLVLGESHPNYAEFAVTTTEDDRAALAISAGVDLPARALRAKGDAAHPNEDAGWLLWSPARVVLAVADAHHGREASHDLLAALHANEEAPPADVAGMRAYMEACLAGLGSRDSRSGAAVLIASIDRVTRQGAFWAVGDCAAFRVDRRGRVHPLVRRRSPFLEREQPEAVAPRVTPVPLQAGDTLVLATDGLHECCYGQPRRSVQPDDMAAVLHGAVGAGQWAARLTQTALTGVRGQPGGQDNVCLALATP